MFLGVILVCGLSNIPTAVEGCVPIPSNRVFREESTCQQSLVIGTDKVKTGLPEGAYVTDAKCVQVSNAT